MAESVLVDTGSWIALFDPKEEHHRAVVEAVELLEPLELVVPWPILYETLRTRFTRRPDWVARLDQRLKKPPVTFIDDADYCDDAYALTVEYSMRRRRDISMVGMVCRLLIDDPHVRINYLLTVTDRCAKRVTSSPLRIEAWTSRIPFRLTRLSGGGFERCT